MHDSFSISLLLKCHSLLHVLNMLMDEFVLQLLSPCKVCLAVLRTWPAYFLHGNVPDSFSQLASVSLCIMLLDI